VTASLVIIPAVCSTRQTGRSLESGVGSPRRYGQKVQEGGASDSRLPTPDSRLPTPDSRLPTPDSRLPTPDSRLPTPFVDSLFPIL
jgi:hypothetical protein